MKQKFNIKRISICLLTFLCMFLVTAEVSAENTMGSVINDVKETSGVKSCTYVQYGTDIAVLELSFNSSNVQLINRVAQGAGFSGFEIYEKAKFSPQFKASDLKGECPSLLFLGTADSNGVVPAKLENFDGATMKLGKKSSFDSIIDSVEDATNNPVNPDDYLVCKYSEISNPSNVIATLTIGPDKIILKNTASFDNEIANENYGEFIKKVTFEPKFSLEDLNGKCPTKLFIGKGSNNTFVAPVKLEYFEGYSMILYRVVNLTDEQIEGTTIDEDICEGKTVGIIKTIFNLIRFLVPIIIIVLSIINFIGVVISGENDKMEKAKKNFVIRLLIGFAILIIPALLELILKLSGLIDSDLATATCKLFK